MVNIVFCYDLPLDSQLLRVGLRFIELILQEFHYAFGFKNIYLEYLSEICQIIVLVASVRLPWSQKKHH